MQASSVDSSLLAALQDIQKFTGSGKDCSSKQADGGAYKGGRRFKITATQRKKHKLIDIHTGYTYTVRKTHKNSTLWQCSTRNKSIYCKATLIQMGNKFRMGNCSHIHPGQIGAAEFVGKKKSSKEKAHPKNTFVQDSPIEMEEICLTEDAAAMQEQNTMEVPEITAGPVYLGSQVTVAQTDTDDMEEDANVGSVAKEQHLEDLDKNHNISSNSPERSQSGINAGANPMPYEVFLQENAEHVEVPLEGNLGPGVGCEVNHTETEGEEFQEERLPEAEYTVIDGSSQRRQAKLIDNAGYTYTLKNKTCFTSYWRCSIRNKNLLCRASVMQTKENFKRGKFNHIHPSKPNCEVAARLVAQVKAKVCQKPDNPTSSIVGEAMLETVGYYTPSPGLPKPNNLARTANRLRHKLSQGVDNIHTASIPVAFLQKVVNCKEKSHILLASPELLQLLSQMTRWYIDINRKVVKAPLKELMSVHSFITDDTGTRPIPLAFVLMSSQKKKDYKAVFSSIKERLPGKCSMEECVVPYEPALWRAISDIFPGVRCSGSSAHWSQAIRKKIKEFEIQRSDSYVREPRKVFRLLQKLVALAFLPAEFIPRMVNELHNKANTTTLHQLLNYLKATWIEGPTCMWSPTVWSVYLEPWRINNELEVWQLQLNSRMKKGKLPLSMLIMHLFNESKVVTTGSNLKPTSKRNLKRHHSMTYKNYQLIKFWKEFQRGDRTLKQLLKACVSLYQVENSLV
ncbi:uncharacterized protein LOC110975938 isoform X3 [Acanthaster planci]|uniref:Uncharacterized protein LOC110975938 isoform X3 n=1 Tax=Acanthaster planci TaxID=133434 RepID=A0A8B7XXJ2_ACAPL|nr:uncharacterized protein LOC110975938 isoform X3 [Acanthaster planci]